MVKIKYNSEILKLMPLFERKTGARVKDCFFDKFEKLWFVIDEGDIGKAIGRNGSAVKRVQALLKQSFRVIEFSADLKVFIGKLIYPLKADEIIIEDGIVVIKCPDTKTKGLLIGRNAQNLRNYESVVKRYFPIKEIKVA